MLLFGVGDCYNFPLFIAPLDDIQIARLNARLEQVSASEASVKKESKELKQQLSRVSQQKQILAKTTEMYEADKRELEHEVYIYILD